VTALGLISGALLALALLDRELDRALSGRREGTPSGPPVDVLWALGVTFGFLVIARILVYL
jgi:hypothetical protein